MAEIILAVVEDLIFLTKIQQTAQRVGVPVEQTDPAEVEERVSQLPVRAVIVDLNHRSGSALEVLRALKANPLARQIKLLGFISHVQTDLAQAARATGCDLVVARSTFSQQLPRLLLQLVGKEFPAMPSS